MTFLRKVLVPLRSRIQELHRERFKAKVLAHKHHLKQASQSYTSHPNVVFVFQLFNKAENCGALLLPLLQYGCQNIIVFADGCIDGSAFVCHQHLPGKNHIVISSNDLHEIRNYRLSIDIAHHWGCRFVVLLQDDDLYDQHLFGWLKDAIRASTLYNAAIIGGNSGSDIDCSFSYQPGDPGLLSAQFCSGIDDEGKSYYALGAYQRMLVNSEFASACGMAPHRFVASVNRAPQLIDIAKARQIRLFPEELEPYQYDDYYNCFQSWLSGYPVVLMPLAKVATNVGIGGMRLYNNVTPRNRPAHFIRNWNFVLDKFSELFGKINQDVVEFNKNFLSLTTR